VLCPPFNSPSFHEMKIVNCEVLSSSRTASFLNSLNNDKKNTNSNNECLLYCLWRNQRWKA